MKMAKASEKDLDLAMNIAAALESLERGHMPAALTPDSDDIEWFDPDEGEDCRRALSFLLEEARRGSLFRVVWGAAVMLDRRNKCADPDADTIEHHPDVIAYERAATARPADEWHEDMGPVLWWRLPVEEPPWCGTPYDDDWRPVYSHWTPLIVPSHGKVTR